MSDSTPSKHIRNEAAPPEERCALNYQHTGPCNHARARPRGWGGEMTEKNKTEERCAKSACRDLPPHDALGGEIAPAPAPLTRNSSPVSIPFAPAPSQERCACGHDKRAHYVNGSCLYCLSSQSGKCYAFKTTLAERCANGMDCGQPASEHKTGKCCPPCILDIDHFGACRPAPLAERCDVTAPGAERCASTFLYGGPGWPAKECRLRKGHDGSHAAVGGGWRWEDAESDDTPPTPAAPLADGGEITGPTDARPHASNARSAPAGVGGGEKCNFCGTTCGYGCPCGCHPDPENAEIAALRERVAELERVIETNERLAEFGAAILDAYTDDWRLYIDDGDVYETAVAYGLIVQRAEKHPPEAECEACAEFDAPCCEVPPNILRAVVAILGKSRARVRG